MRPSDHHVAHDRVADPGGAASVASSSLLDPWWFHLDLDVLSTDALPAID